MGKRRRFPLMLKDSIDFKSHLKAVSEEIEAVLTDILPLPSGNQKAVMEATRYAALGGGKRLRPFLMIETARMLGQPKQRSIYCRCRFRMHACLFISA